MTQLTKIEWTDFTVNFWEGCQKVGPGCDNCYAEARDQRFTGGVHWGPGAQRRKVKGGIAKLRKINQNAKAFREEHGHWPRVFCSSLSDVFDNAVDPAWRREAIAAITVAPNARVQLLTKRIGNVADMIPSTWKDGWPHWVGLMITVVNQTEADRDVPKLLELKARFGIPWVGLSVEPMLNAVDLLVTDRRGHDISSLRGIGCNPTNADGPDEYYTTEKIDWVICGGESGPKARPMHPDWVRRLRDQCVAAGTPFFFKQWGHWEVEIDRDTDDPDWGANYKGLLSKGRRILNLEGGHGIHGERVCVMRPVGKARSGRSLDGTTWSQVPKEISP